jgi:hypothetical protein
MSGVGGEFEEGRVCGGAGTLFPTRPPSAAYGWGTRAVVVVRTVLGLWGGALAAGVGPVGFDFDATGLAGEVVAVAGPGPVFGLFDVAAIDGVAVHVLQFFNVLAVGEDVEVVVTSLPELLAVAFEVFGGFGFQDVEGCGERVEPGLAE